MTVTTDQAKIYAVRAAQYLLEDEVISDADYLALQGIIHTNAKLIEIAKRLDPDVLERTKLKLGIGK